ncbi:hypothetical protein F4777DRAFT_576815 [Nemania sp. FL0916]|nr:hypothetical protein F4777DRAFT_576815 [Nemania sp. FL0916]
MSSQMTKKLPSPPPPPPISSVLSYLVAQSHVACCLFRHTVGSLPAAPPPVARISHQKDEPLVQYYGRIQNALRQAGGRDYPRVGDNDSLSTAETTLLRTVIGRFVDGLQDFKLRQEALSNRARSCRSIRMCYEAIPLLSPRPGP